MINIAGMPVYRDSEGGVGTPTSDHERTKVTLSLSLIHICIIKYFLDIISPNNDMLDKMNRLFATFPEVDKACLLYTSRCV